MTFSKTKHLQKVLDSHKMGHIQDVMDKALKKRDQIKDALATKFNGKLATRAINSGSYAKHTAINIKFDIDISQPFKYSSFGTLEEMADEVYNYFNNEYEDGDLQEVRNQSKSTGLVFLIDGDEIAMDVVPGRELSISDYVTTNSLNLHVRAEDGNEKTSTQTNIKKHTEHINGKSKERPVIRLLKVWKHNKGKKHLKSFFMELIVIRAFKNEDVIPSDMWDRLKFAMEFICDNAQTIRLEDPGNSNNVVSEDLTSHQKKNLSADMKTILDRIAEKEENIKIYFEVNSNYDDDEDNAGPAILTTTRFS